MTAARGQSARQTERVPLPCPPPYSAEGEGPVPPFCRDRAALAMSSVAAFNSPRQGALCWEELPRRHGYV